MNNAEAFLKEGILVDSELNEDLGNIKVSLVDVFKALNIRFLSKNDFKENFYKIKVILENLKERKGPEEREEREYVQQAIDYLSKFYVSEAEEVKEKSKNSLPKKEVKTFHKQKSASLGNVRVLKCYDPPPREITVSDFTEHFKARYMAIKSILQGHNELENLMLINKIPPNSKNISIIGIVYEKRITKNKNIMLNVEDLTGRISVVVNSSKKELVEKCSQVVPDEVLGFRCSGNSEVLFANDIIFPDIENGFNKRRTESEEYAVFISDIHVGSNTFLEKNLLKFIDWINGNSGTQEQQEMVKKIRYLFITGDTVDGVGVYPGQEDRLDIKDIKLQYDKLAEYLGKIKKDITIIMCPGQHDCVRVHEPQPPVGEDFAEKLYKIENTVIVSNPSWIEVGRSENNPGVLVLMYHGASFHPLISEISELRFGKANLYPTKVIKHWLKKRHLGPPHSTTTHIPIVGEDPFVITEVPDILVTGDMHRADVANYKGVMMINSSCWQSQTEFEVKVGNTPDPCKAIIVNLKTWEVKIMDFSEPNQNYLYKN